VVAVSPTSVNSEKQTVVVRGVVRPVDLTTANTVTSGQVADLSIQVNGKGVVGDAIRRPHFLYRLLLGLLPF
jgi:flagellar L-ring protein FlgH